MRRMLLTVPLLIALIGCRSYSWHNLLVGYDRPSPEEARLSACVKENLRSPDYPVMMRACKASCRSTIGARNHEEAALTREACALTCSLDLRFTGCPGTYPGSSLLKTEPHGFAHCARNHLEDPGWTWFDRSGPCASEEFRAAARRFLRIEDR